MNNYYLTLVLKPNLEEKARKSLLDNILDRLVKPRGENKEEGKVVKEDLWGLKDLIYSIKRNNKGFFAHFEIMADPENIKGLDRNLDLEEDVLRYLLIKR